MARAVRVRELEHRVERQLRLERLLQVGQRAVRDLRSRTRVRLRELETHDDTLQEAGVQVDLGLVVEVGGPHRVHVRRELRPRRADQVLQLQALAGELVAETLPRERGVGLAGRGGLRPRRTRRHVMDRLRVDAELDEHRVDDHLPAGAAERDRLALQILRRLDRAVRRQGEVEDLTRDHVPDRLDSDAAVDRRGQHAGGRIAHVSFVLGDELRRRERVGHGACDQLRVDPERLEIPHLERNPQVEVVHHLQRPAGRDPADGLHRRRRARECAPGG